MTPMELLLLQQGVIAYQANDLGKAESLFDAVLRLAPRNTDALHFLGLVSAARHQHTEAITWISKAIATNPNAAHLHANLASSQRELRQFNEALASTDQALKLDPSLTEALNTRGNILRVLGRLDEALQSLNAALRLQPGFVEAHDNRGNVLREMGHLDEAIASYRQARKLAPQYASAAWNESLCLLLNGQLLEGWPLYEAGWAIGLRSPWVKSAAPLFTGKEPLREKTILVHAEQGLGDTIQFCRYLRLLTEQGASVIFEVQAPLCELLREALPDISILAQPAQPPRHDYHVPLLSLPGIFQTTLETVPALVPLKYSSRLQLQASGKLRIGLAWAGNPRLENDRNRSISPAELDPLFTMDAEFHYLQPDVRSEDEAYLARHAAIIDHRQAIHDFRDTASLVGQMDLIISVDTAVAHLAASLEKPTWILLPAIPDWRWLLQRGDSPWYPSVRLFRRSPQGSWKDLVIAELLPRLQSLRMPGLSSFTCQSRTNQA